MIVHEFAAQARSDSMIPVIFLVNNLGYSDYLFQALKPALNADKIPYVSSDSVVSPNDPRGYLPDSHFTDDGDDELARELVKLTDNLKQFQFGQRAVKRFLEDTLRAARGHIRMEKDVEVLTQRDLRVGQVKLPRLPYKSCESLAARQLSIRPFVQEKVPGEEGVLHACRHLPVKQSECADVFKKRIKATLGKDRLSKARRFERFIGARRGNAHHFDPEADRSDHILANPQLHHSLLFVPKRGWILHNSPGIRFRRDTQLTQ